MSDLTIDYNKITYSNSFTFNGKTLAFRKKKLYDITGTPIKLNQYNNNGTIGWYVGNKFLSLNYAKGLIEFKAVEKDISNLQWYQQIDLLK